MADNFLAEIRVFGCNFAPVGWAQCNGQILPISQNTALFSLLGVNYGGNGTSNFALPNFQGNAPLAAGQGQGLTSRALGEIGGEASVTLTTAQMSTHNHAPNAELAGTVADPNLAIFANPGGKVKANYYATPIGTAQTMSATSLGNTGSTQPHNNLMPYLPLNFCIAMTGIYPARS